MQNDCGVTVTQVSGNRLKTASLLRLKKKKFYDFCSDQSHINISYSSGVVGRGRGTSLPVGYVNKLQSRCQTG